MKLPDHQKDGKKPSPATKTAKNAKPCTMTKKSGLKPLNLRVQRKKRSPARPYGLQASKREPRHAANSG
jgi:hypothetical protein